MTVGGVRPGAGTPAAIPKTAGAPTGATPAAGMTPATQGGTASTPSAGASSLIGADGKVRTGWGLVEAPEVKPTDPGNLIEMPKYGDVEMPAPRPDLEGKLPEAAELPAKPEIISTPKPLTKTKFSITTGPPQGDP